MADPKLAMHVFLLGPEQQIWRESGAHPAALLMVFDGHGEAHGRSDKGFKWALDIEGVIDTTKEMSLGEICDLQGSYSPPAFFYSLTERSCSGQ